LDIFTAESPFDLQAAKKKHGKNAKLLVQAYLKALDVRDRKCKNHQVHYQMGYHRANEELLIVNVATR
jgi:hypothetical protein